MQTKAIRRVAAIDIGTNSVRLARGVMNDGRFCMEQKDLETTRIGEGTTTTDRLSDEPMRRTADAVAFFARQAAVHQAADNPVGGQLKAHGHASGKNGRHAEQRKAQRRRDRAHSQGVYRPAQKAAQQHRQVHGGQGAADLRNLPCQKGQHHAQSQADGADNQLHQRIAFERHRIFSLSKLDSVLNGRRAVAAH